MRTVMNPLAPSSDFLPPITASGVDSLTLLTDVTVVSQGVAKPHHHVVVANGCIQSISAEAPADFLMQQSNVTVINGNNQPLTVGLVDLQCNGAFGIDVNHATAAQIRVLLKQLAQTGTTHVMLTLITAPLEDMIRAIQTLESVIREPRPDEAHVLGIHLEGPFLNPLCGGIHPPTAMPRKISIATLETLCSPSVKLVTLAPELPGALEAIGWLTKRGITVFAGHTAATAAEAMMAFDAGVTGVTHLFNAMKPFHHRAPGLISVALTHPHVTITLIADGHHVYPEALRLAITAKGAAGAGKVVLVSDSMPLAGTPVGTQGHFGGQTITHQAVKGLPVGKAANADGTLAGSVALLNHAVGNVQAWGLADLPTTIAMASENPAAAVGMTDGSRTGIGTLTADGPANWVLWDAETWTPLQVGL
ncbi:MAG: N-acetylglucosamine-6-phosphate deacetylase [Vampirovibrionales bacterium]|nr:N-acetylglucosamine-6-phosphate deacetylase [Vampirovibrionales bacterium]